MLADFLEPLWKWLFEKTGVFGLVIASFAPILAIGLVILLFAVVIGVIGGFAGRIKNAGQEKLLKSAKHLWSEDKYDEAMEAMLKLAKRRKLTAEEKYILALICEDGEDEGWLYTRKECSSEYWLKQAEEEGWPEALGYTAFKALLSATSHLEAAKAVYRMRIAESKGAPDAKQKLDDYEKRLIEKGANKVTVSLVMGDADMQLALYRELFNKGGKDREAMEWLKLAGDYGNADALCLAGGRYIVGDGVKQDVKEGERLLKMAADRKHATACELLGSFYYEGLGGKKDIYKARDWYEKTVELDENRDHAVYGLAVIYDELLNERMQQLKMDTNVIMEDRTCLRYSKEYFKWLKKAIKLGNQEAKARQEEFYNASEYGNAVRIMDSIMKDDE